MTSHPTITCPCPRYVLPRLISILRHHGTQVSCHNNEEHGPTHIPITGTAIHDSGKFTFLHRDEILTITITHSPGHFPIKLLIGGIKQLVEETIESEQKARRANLRASFSVDGDRFKFKDY
jgi:hypothetical protein